MKTILFSITIIFCLQGFGQVATPQSLRHFMQAGLSPVDQIPYGNNPKAGHYVNAGDARIYYEVYGKGQPILVLHGGLFGSTIEMADFINKLKQTNQVIAVSTRGHGKSEIGSQPLTLDQRANDALAVINAVTRDSVIVLGFSDGGYTAYKLAAMYPAKVKKMIVIGAGELYPGLREFPDMKKARDMDKAYWDQQFKLMPEPGRIDEVFDQIVNCYSHLTVGKDLLGAIKCPVLVMAGDRDQGNTVEHVVAAARMISQHQISIIPNTTHTVFLENFPAVRESIGPFLLQ
jgi:pimeloyl-ACP methyl ester carboxylesterase